MILEIYECIQADDRVSELVFASTFQPRMVDIQIAMEEAETQASEMDMRYCEARAGQRDPVGQTGGNQAGRGTEATPRWHIQKTFKPKHLMTLKMTMQEVHIWYCEWDQYFEVSR